jgi:hypothetical protein
VDAVATGRQLDIEIAVVAGAAFRQPRQMDTSGWKW